MGPSSKELLCVGPNSKLTLTLKSSVFLYWIVFLPVIVSGVSEECRVQLSRLWLRIGFLQSNANCPDRHFENADGADNYTNALCFKYMPCKSILEHLLRSSAVDGNHITRRHSTSSRHALQSASMLLSSAFGRSLGPYTYLFFSHVMVLKWNWHVCSF